MSRSHYVKVLLLKSRQFEKLYWSANPMWPAPGRKRILKFPSQGNYLPLRGSVTNTHPRETFLGPMSTIKVIWIFYGLHVRLCCSCILMASIIFFYSPAIHLFPSSCWATAGGIKCEKYTLNTGLNESAKKHLSCVSWAPGFTYRITPKLMWLNIRFIKYLFSYFIYLLFI